MLRFLGLCYARVSPAARQLYDDTTACLPRTLASSAHNLFSSCALFCTIAKDTSSSSSSAVMALPLPIFFPGAPALLLPPTEPPMPNALFLLLLILVALSAQARPMHGHVALIFPTFWSSYGMKVDGLAAAFLATQARLQDGTLTARASAIPEDLRRSLAEIIIAGSI